MNHACQPKNRTFCAAVPEIGIERYREIIVRPYRVIYETRKNDLVILRVRHSRRDLPE